MRPFWVSLLAGFIGFTMLHAQPGTWAWMKGDQAINYAGNFGTLGVASSTNNPPAFYQVSNWQDNQGNFWIFGGNNDNDSYSDLWKYNPSTNQWTWIKGPGIAEQIGNYGTQGIPSSGNNPGARSFASACWKDLSGNFWLFGGAGRSSGGPGMLNDLWRYSVSTNQWTWMRGSNLANSSGNYGTIGVASATNDPPARSEVNAAWVDDNGNLWMFGGYNGADFLGDLWKYDPSTNQWTWMNGSNLVNVPPVYGTQGVMSASNQPGGRNSYGNWKDNCGNLWMFGGSNYNSTGQFRNDFWKYNLAANQWTWMDGANVISDQGNSGASCTFAPSTLPSARMETKAMWTDSDGRFWFYGGQGFNLLSDELWVYDPNYEVFARAFGTGFTTTAVYGTQTVASASNTPGGRCGAAPFQDQAGNLWLFGGMVPGGSTRKGDLWKFIVNANCPALLASPVASFTPTQISGCSTLTVNFSNTSGSGAQFYWTFGDGGNSTLTNPSHTYTIPGVYQVQLVSTIGCLSDTSVGTVTVGTPINLIPFADTVLCREGSYILDAGTYAGAVYQWSNGPQTQFDTVTTSGNYSVTVSNGGCTDSDTVQVTIVNQPNLGSDTSLCSPFTNITLDAGAGYSTYDWNTGFNTQTILVTTSGFYSVTVSSATCTLSDSIMVNIYPKPLIELGADTLICQSDTLILDAGPGFVQYQWNNGPNTQTIPVIGTATGLGTFYYWVEILDTNGCIAHDTIAVTVTTCTGIDDPLNDEVKVYPSPAGAWLNIEFSHSPGVLISELWNVSGQLILEKKLKDGLLFSIDVSRLARGVYILRFREWPEKSWKIILE